MTPFGKALKKGTIKRTQNNYEQVLGLEKQILAAVDDVKNAGISEEKINQQGQMTVWQRLEYIVDPGTWTPLHTLFNPADNVEGTTNVIDGLGKIAGKWAVVIGFDNKVMAGAWLAGQSENILRVTDLAKIVNIPLVWLVNCSGAKLTEQEKFYANRRGSGTPFSGMRNLSRTASPCWPPFTAPTLPAAATTPSAPRSFCP
jgi:glutaconyl-CoA decarboxylase alpha subunit (EC 4.1.1.70)